MSKQYNNDNHSSGSTTVPKLGRRIYPRRYKNNDITEQQAADLCDNKANLGRRYQVNGLTYCVSQMPNEISDNNWPHVLRAPTETYSPRFASFNLGGGRSIIVHHPPVGIEKNSDLHAATEFALQNHSRNRVIEGESGEMVGGGNRFEPISSCALPYVNKNFKGVGGIDNRGHYVFNKGVISFQKLICSNTSFKETFRADIKRLKRSGNVLKLRTDNKIEYDGHLSYAITKNLSNSPHVDINDDSKSFAVFYTLIDEPGLTWFLFPEYGIAVELSGTVCLSWDGRKEYHCSCTVRGNVYSLFASSRKDVSRHLQIKKAFSKKISKKKSSRRPLEVGDKVYVRDNLKNMVSLRKHTDFNARKYPRHIMFRQAEVVDIGPSKHSVSVLFTGNLSKLGRQEFNTLHVRRIVEVLLA